MRMTFVHTSLWLILASSLAYMSFSLIMMEECMSIDTENLVKFILKRLKAVVDAKGYSTT